MIDGGIFLGRNPRNGRSLAAADILRHLDAQGAGPGIVSSYKAVFFDDREGNEEVMRLARRHPERVIPAVTFNARRFDASADGGYLSGLRERGARVFGVYAEPCYYDVEWASPLLMAAVREAASLGYVIQFGVKNERDLAEVLRLYSDVKAPVLVRWMGGGAYRALAESIHAARTLPNFYFDTASLTGAGMIAHFAGAAGADKLYWASNAPEQFAMAGRFVLEASGVDAKEKDRILSGTLASILGVRPADKKSPVSALFRKFSAIPKIDTHWHLEHWNLIEPGKDEKGFAAVLKQSSVRKAVFSSIRALNGEMAEGNRAAFRFASQNRGIFALVVVDPTLPKASLAEIRRYAKHKRCAGVKTIQDLYRLGLGDAEYAPILRAAEQNDLTVMAHLPGMAEAAQKNPGLRFVAAHATYARAKNLFALPNVYFDLATSHRNVSETSFERFLAGAGEGRLLFASDAPLIHPAWTAGKLAEAGFSTGTLRRIFWENARKAFPRLR